MGSVRHAPALLPGGPGGGPTCARGHPVGHGAVPAVLALAAGRWPSGPTPAGAPWPAGTAPGGPARSHSGPAAHSLVQAGTFAFQGHTHSF